MEFHRIVLIFLHFTQILLLSLGDIIGVAIEREFITTVDGEKKINDNITFRHQYPGGLRGL